MKQFGRLQAAHELLHLPGGAFQTVDRNSNGAFNSATAFLAEVNPNLSGTASLVYSTLPGR